MAVSRRRDPGRSITVTPLGARDETVLLLHGLSRTSSSLSLMRAALRSRGYGTVSVNYPSTRLCIEELPARVMPLAIAGCHGLPTLVVTHSMGGILLRTWLRDASIPRLARSVMLTPPNGGTEVIDTLSSLRLFQGIVGPAGCQLGTGDEHLPCRLPPAGSEVGIIAGNRSVNPIVLSMIDGEDDGKVSVASTRLEGMSDHIVLPITHTTMPAHPVAIAPTMAFLHQGRFHRDLSLAAALRSFLRVAQRRKGRGQGALARCCPARPPACGP